MNNTLLGRCVAAFEDRYERTGPLEDPHEPCVAAVLRHLAAELVVMSQRNPRLTVFEAARIICEQSEA